MKLCVFTATYNEVSNIQTWYRRLRSVQPNCHILIIDDSSTDGTLTVLKKIQDDDPLLSLIIRPKKMGLGSAHKLAFEECYRKGFDLIITMDADLSHDPFELPKFIASSTKWDFVIGTRWGLGTCDYKGIRFILSWTANRICRILLPSNLTEYTTSFRLLNARAMKKLLEKPPKDDGYAFFIESIEILYDTNLSLGEVPIAFRDRELDQSKIPKLHILSASWAILSLFLKRVRALWLFEKQL